MNLKDFDYDLPQDLIAQYPLKKRDQAKLLIVDRKQQSIGHDVFANIGNYLPPKSCIVFNDSKVIPARLLGKREESGGQVEIFLLNKLDDGYSYEVLMRPTKRLKVNEKIYFDQGKCVAQIIDKKKRIVRFNKKNILSHLNKVGHIPLPPYIQRPDEAVDRKYYQTVYAKNSGSVASPTAGLHFTNRLITKLSKAGHGIEYVTLHVNYGTFKPVEETDIKKHKMHTEEYQLKQSTFNKVYKAKEQKRAVVAVGTTSCRVLESVAQNKQLAGSTNIFMYPGFKFRLTDVLITNFHLPRSTLLMLVYAFGSKELMVKAYQEAIRANYRFYSYGDAMIIL